MEACDRIGMYVFDAWGIMKQPGDYNQYFDTDWEKDLTAFMKRDRNHPSVTIWSTGNEIPERGGLGNGYTLATTGAVSSIKLIAERQEMPADGHSVTYVQAELLDSDGNIVPDADNKLTATVTGEGSLAAFGSANPITDENYTTGSFTAYRGRTTAIIRSGYTSGTCTLTVSGKGLESVTTTINIK